jgi:hypothetical protein
LIRKFAGRRIPHKRPTDHHSDIHALGQQRTSIDCDDVGHDLRPSLILHPLSSRFRVLSPWTPYTARAQEETNGALRRHPQRSPAHRRIKEENICRHADHGDLQGGADGGPAHNGADGNNKQRRPDTCRTKR